MSDDSNPGPAYFASSLNDLADRFQTIADNIGTMAASMARTERDKRDAAIRAATWREAAEMLRRTTIGRR
jgi:hypothetical protein